MGTHVAFLRAINVGGRRVTGSELEDAFVACGLAAPHSYQASGNVAFDAGAGAVTGDLEKVIEVGLAAALGWEVPTMVRTGAQVTHAALAEPFTPAQVAASTGKVQVSMLKAQPDPADEAAVLAMATDDDCLHVDGRELYWLPRAGLSDAALDVLAIERMLGMQTRRTQGTLQRMVARFDLDG